MNSFWGDDSWEEVSYTKQQGLFEEIEEKTGIKAVESASVKGSRKSVFGFVPEPIPMRNTKGAIIYYLFFASPNETGGKIVKEIFDKYRDKGIV